jgi:hypothetical protein
MTDYHFQGIRNRTKHEEPQKALGSDVEEEANTFIVP